MKNETMKERAERKAYWITRCTSHFDTDKIREEAGEEFEKMNPIEKCIDYKKCPFPKGKCLECSDTKNTFDDLNLFNAFLGVTKMKEHFEGYIKLKQKEAVEDYKKSLNK